MARTSTIYIAPKPACTSTEQAFEICISGDVDQTFYRQISITFFVKLNNRMVVMLEWAAKFAKDEGVSSMSETLMTETDSDSVNTSDVSQSSDESQSRYYDSYKVG